ncbi:hypothetical protein H8B13_16520 [Hymenobacter sp. BT188]|uniref:hypothetical protein n=1 Tax=Hymenobacter sp. BT188 TaxID=2763504 RepID=UPI001650FB30|nr:hypothetical protein [Hymenobacter sp. BT188]MBC6608432.1 hypothetical protein [Hymenobacter sp. BT188]
MNATSNASTPISSLIGWLFGLLALAIGIVNTFWGNDPGFGLFIIALSLAFFPPVNAFIKAKAGFAIPRIVKWLLGFFILWASLGVGELFDKIDLMMASF